MTTEQRLERLERENRWIKRIEAVGILAVGIAVVAAVFLLGQGKDVLSDLKVHSLIITDKNGRARAKLGTWDNKGGFPYLALLDSSGVNRLNLSVRADVPTLTLSDGAGTGRAILSTQPDGSSVLSLLDKDAAQVMLFVSAQAGEVGFNILGKDSKQLRVALGGLPDGRCALTFLDANGKVIWQAPKD